MPASPDMSFPGGSVPVLPSAVAFFLDIDGTLVEFADRPSQVSIGEELRRMLEALRDAAGGALALISGRSVADMDRLLSPSRFCVAGQHGAERRDAAGMVHRHGLQLSRLRDASERLSRVAERYPALVLEDKGMTLALHYRLGPELGPKVRELIERFARDLGEEFEVQEGKMVFEIKPSGRDKGTAIADYMKEEPFREGLPVFIGDDHTDEYGFRIVNRLGGYSIKVGKGPTAARWRLRDAAAVRMWLARFVESSKPAART
jgi:trehalose 6-phosphate phosphatase